MRKWILFWVILTAVGVLAAKPGQVAKVMAGELKVARASWWGFDKENATRALQDAISSRVPLLIVDNMDAPWIADQLTCVSDQEIRFEKGVEVLAKKGLFMGKSDVFLSLICVTNVTLRGPGATLRMRRADYDAAPYEHAQWRHVLSIKSSINIKVYGLTLAESGGDGIYLGSMRGMCPNRDVHIKDVICDKNYRQGISVISAENLLIENTVMRGTAGSSPSDGIDFEPNKSSEQLKNCVLRNCVTENNKGDGYGFSLPLLTRESEPVSILIENCRSSGDSRAVRVSTGNADDDAVRGSITFTDCVFEKSKRNGVFVDRKPASGIKLAFDQCVIADCAATTNIYPDILFSNRSTDEWPVGGIRLDRMTIRQPVLRPWLMCKNNAVDSETVTALTGRVMVEQGGTRQKIMLTPEWLAATFPPRFTVRVPRVSADLTKAHVVDGVEGLQKLPPMRLRRNGAYMFYATAGIEAILVGQHSPVGKYPNVAKVHLVRSSTGKVVKKVPPLPFKERTEIRFTPEVTGFYMLDVEVGANAFLLLEANVPVAFDTTKKAVNLISSTGTLFAALPQGTGVFAFGVAGDGDGELIKATVTDPSGKAVWTQDAISLMERFTATEGQGTVGGLWQLKVERPGKGRFEDFYVEVLGAPGYLFLSRDRYWTF